jgi:hypothetical protein
MHDTNFVQHFLTHKSPPMRLASPPPEVAADNVPTATVGVLCYQSDMARSPRPPLWPYAVAVAIGFALGAGLALLLVR